ncbi:hypothetical protein EVAR_41817_1 [Eumeta japonica]|uniref:Uncharacterized protein n=1 Tax=Eumeta variegata TaxID=151549 RepID=A0A4C1X8J4_EUMVA|nr:hypothetical protein EVAR_41817_1 [Eumeta japonica]
MIKKLLLRPLSSFPQTQRPTSRRLPAPPHRARIHIPSPTLLHFLQSPAGLDLSAGTSERRRVDVFVRRARRGDRAACAGASDLAARQCQHSNK